MVSIDYKVGDMVEFKPEHVNHKGSYGRATKIYLYRDNTWSTLVEWEVWTSPHAKFFNVVPETLRLCTLRGPW